jgi:site-specific recombinase XerD
MRWQFPENQAPESFPALAREFLLHAQVEYSFSRESVEKYGECLKQVWFAIGGMPVCKFSQADLLSLRSNWLARSLSASRQTSLLLSLRRFLLFCQDEKHLALGIDPAEIKPPRRPRREVIYLTPEEVEKFIVTIPVSTTRGATHHAGLRLRAIVETILGSGMRISEALSLNRDSIDFERCEARVVGKGNKERTVFFTDRALIWIKRYVKSRDDDSPVLFVCQNGRDRLKRDDIWRYFERHRKLAGIRKKVTPHILRHTAATQLLFNGCPVGHIKAILGHERLETTCRYYLGLDQRAAKEAHRKFLSYDVQPTGRDSVGSSAE